jgi:predicted GIY-YIG superfamily endonuclease
VVENGEYNMYLIYKYTSPSGKSYIGQTKNIKEREKQHKKSKSCRAFYYSIQKYGFKNFVREILEEHLTIDDANRRESYWIDFYNTIVPNGYNLRTGGLNNICSEETKIKMSKNRPDTNGENNPFFGKHHTDETKELLRICNIGKVHTEETKTKIGLSTIGRSCSVETKQKLSIARSGENNPMYGKSGILSPHFGNTGELSPNSKRYIITFPDGSIQHILGLAEFCRSNCLNSSSMIGVAKGERLQHKGFLCAYDIK